MWEGTVTHVGLGTTQSVNTTHRVGPKRVLPAQRFQGVSNEPVPKCNNTEIDDATRDAYLNQHNEYRSSLARGKGFNGNWLGYAPKANNMQKM
ncbi:hypothetical protein GCK32_014308, partial [Trichostrongylus colubriformis]